MNEYQINELRALLNELLAFTKKGFRYSPRFKRDLEALVKKSNRFQKLKRLIAILTSISGTRGLGELPDASLDDNEIKVRDMLDGECLFYQCNRDGKFRILAICKP